MAKPTHKHTCLQCGYQWDGRLEHPKECPECKSRRWNQPVPQNIIKIELKE